MGRDPIAPVFAQLALREKRHELAELRLADDQQEEPATHLQHAINTLDPDSDAVETIECGLQGSTIAFIMVDSVAATIEAVTAQGGTLVQPIGADAPEITARFRDPAGNVVGLYQEPGR